MDRIWSGSDPYHHVIVISGVLSTFGMSGL